MLPQIIHETHEVLPIEAGIRYNTTIATVYDFVLPRYSDYLYSICFHCHPLLIDRYSNGADRYRLTAADVEYVQLLFNDQPIITRYNGYRDEPFVYPHQIDALWTAPVEFFRDTPLVTAALNGEVKLRIVFWRQPVTPFWLTFTLGYVANKYTIPNRIVADAYDGREMHYCWGSLCASAALY